MDDADAAQAEQDLLLSTAMNSITSKREVEQAVPSADDCAECGELIPSARQIAVPGCQHCIICAENFERLNNRRGK